MNINSPLTNELKEKEYRDGYVASQIAIGLPNQIRSLRTGRSWTQGDLARRAQMAQPRISEIETPGERKLNLDTLLRLASAFDIGLEVSFVSFSELVDRSEGFDPDSFSIKNFDDEIRELGKQQPNTRHLRKLRHPHRSNRRRRKFTGGLQTQGNGVKVEIASGHASITPSSETRTGLIAVNNIGAQHGSIGYQDAAAA